MQCEHCAHRKRLFSNALADTYVFLVQENINLCTSVNEPLHQGLQPLLHITVSAFTSFLDPPFTSHPPPFYITDHLQARFTLFRVVAGAGQCVNCSYFRAHNHLQLPPQCVFWCEKSHGAKAPCDFPAAAYLKWCRNLFPEFPAGTAAHCTERAAMPVQMLRCEPSITSESPSPLNQCPSALSAPIFTS